MIKRIFLDLDDVCNNFTMYALNYVGCYCDSDSFDVFNPEWGFNIIKAANSLHPCPNAFTLESFWAMFSRSAWAGVPESAEFRPLLKLCEELVGRENICILTSPIDDPACLAGKLDWIHKHFPKWMHRQYLIGPPKYLCARPDALLIDDCDANVRAFRENGGVAITMPRPWNIFHYHSWESMDHVKNVLSTYFPYMKAAA